MYEMLCESHVSSPEKHGMFRVSPHSTVAEFLCAPPKRSEYRTRRSSKISGGDLRACTDDCVCQWCMSAWTRCVSPAGISSERACAVGACSVSTTTPASSTLADHSPRKQTGHSLEPMCVIYSTQSCCCWGERQPDAISLQWNRLWTRTGLEAALDRHVSKALTACIPRGVTVESNAEVPAQPARVQGRARIEAFT